MPRQISEELDESALKRVQFGPNGVTGDIISSISADCLCPPFRESEELWLHLPDTNSLSNPSRPLDFPSDLDSNQDFLPPCAFALEACYHYTTRWNGHYTSVSFR